MTSVDPSMIFNVDIIITSEPLAPSYVTYTINSDDYIDDPDAKIIFGNNNSLKIGHKVEKICTCNNNCDNNCDDCGVTVCNNNSNICKNCKKTKMRIISKQEYSEANTQDSEAIPYIIITNKENIVPQFTKSLQKNNIYQIFGHFNTSISKLRKTIINLSRFPYHYEQLWTSNEIDSISIKISKNYNSFQITSNYVLPDGYEAANSVKFVICIDGEIYDFAEIEKSNSSFINRTITVPKSMMEKNKFIVTLIQSDNLFIVLQNKNVISAVFKFNPANHLEIRV